ncbi:MAG TPA: SGNH/GDSL hydrolase family protein [Cyclobacteriaceae bacterium]|nr:SGNH/GDSL hydrolase family protein [Cyclobacteriaceae bacterium]
MNKFSRRHFFEKSLFLLPMPAIFSFSPGLFKNATASQPFSEDKDKELIAKHLKEKDPLIWVFIGDSITHGAKHTHGYRSYPEVFSERVRYELGRVRDVVINTGISGNTTQNILDDFDWRVKQFNPRIVSLMIGTNDCATGRIPIALYEKNLNLLVDKIRDLDAIPILHTPNLIITSLDPSRAALEKYTGVIRKVASEAGVILVDNYKHWQDTLEGPDGMKVHKVWLNDPLHPNGHGHSELAREMFRELSIFDPEAPTCGAPYYEGEH